MARNVRHNRETAAQAYAQRDKTLASPAAQNNYSGNSSSGNKTTNNSNKTTSTTNSNNTSNKTKATGLSGRTFDGMTYAELRKQMHDKEAIFNSINNQLNSIGNVASKIGDTYNQYAATNNDYKYVSKSEGQKYTQNIVGNINYVRSSIADCRNMLENNKSYMDETSYKSSVAYLDEIEKYCNNLYNATNESTNYYNKFKDLDDYNNQYYGEKYKNATYSDIQKAKQSTKGDEKKWLQDNENKYKTVEQLEQEKKKIQWDGSPLSLANYISTKQDYTHQIEQRRLADNKAKSEELTQTADKNTLELLDMYNSAEDEKETNFFNSLSNAFSGQKSGFGSSFSNGNAEKKKQYAISELKKTINPKTNNYYTDAEISVMAKVRKSQTNAENAQQLEQQAQQFSDSSGTLGFVGARALNFVGGIAGTVDSLYQLASTGTIDANNGAMNISNVANKLDEENLSRIDNKALKIAYQTGAGIVDNILRAVASAGSGSGAGALMSLQIFPTAFKESQEKGYSISKSITNGIVQGVIEGLTEKYSLETVLGAINTKSAFAALLKSFAAEASEEVASNWLNRLYDAFVNGNYDEFHTNINEYINSGLSEKDAVKQSLLDCVVDDLDSAIVGGLSGAGMGAGGVAINAVNRTKAGTEIKSNNKADELIKLGQQSDNKNIKKMADKLAKKQGSYNLGQLQSMIVEDAYEKARQSGEQIFDRQDLVDNLVKEGMSNYAANVYANKAEDAFNSNKSTDDALNELKNDSKEYSILSKLIIRNSMDAYSVQSEAVETIDNVAEMSLTKQQQADNAQSIIARSGETVTTEDVADKLGHMMSDTQIQEVTDYLNGGQLKGLTLDIVTNSNEVTQALKDIAHEKETIAYDKMTEAEKQNSVDQRTVENKLTGVKTLLTDGTETELKLGDKIINGKVELKTADGTVITSDKVGSISDKKLAAQITIAEETKVSNTSWMDGTTSFSRLMNLVSEDANDNEINSIVKNYIYGKNGFNGLAQTIGIDQKTAQMAYNIGKVDKLQAEVDTSIKQKAEAKKAKLEKAQKIFEQKQEEAKAQGVNETLETVEDFIEDVDESSTINADGINVENLKGKKKTAYNMVKLVASVAKNTTFDIIDDINSTQNGFCATDGSKIVINLSAKSNVGEELGVLALAHELTHWLRAKNIKSYKNVANIICEEYSGKDLDKLINEWIYKHINGDTEEAKTLKAMNTAELYDYAFEEVVAQHMESLFNDGNMADKLIKIAKADQSAFDKIKGFVDGFIDKIKEATQGGAISTIGAKAEQRLYYRMDEIQNEFAKALFNEPATITKSEFVDDVLETSTVGAEDGLSKNNPAINEIATGEKDSTTTFDVEIPKFKPNFSKGTFELVYEAKSGKDVTREVMIANGLAEQAYNAIAYLEEMKKFMQKAGVKYKFIGLKDVEDAHIRVRYDDEGNISGVVMSALVKNGDYPVNIDFTTICKKRQAMSLINSLLAKKGAFETYKLDENGKIMLDDKGKKIKNEAQVALTERNIWKLNNVLLKEGYETACLGCFVESKRYHVQAWADELIAEWNKQVTAYYKKNKLGEPEYFGFAQGITSFDDMTEQQIADSYESTVKYQMLTGGVKRQNKINRLQRRIENKENNDVLAFLKDATKAEKRDLKDGSRTLADINIHPNISKAEKERLQKSTEFTAAEKAYYLENNVNNLSIEEYERLVNSGVLGGGSTTKEQKIKAFIEANPNARKLLSVGDLITKEGIQNLLSLSDDANGVIYAFYGSATPKLIQGFTPYNSEIAMLPDKKSGKQLSEYLYSIAGLRMQSFSDFQVENVFDYMQMIADAAARKIPAHAYTKEISFAKIFGMTDIKINLSVMFDVDSSAGLELAGLIEYNPAVHGEEYIIDKNGNKVLNHYAKIVYENNGKKYVYNVGDYHMQQAWDEYYKSQGKNRPLKFLQSIGFADAVNLEFTEGYSKNCGIIGVGYSYAHIVAMLRDNRIRYVIPYHASSLPSVIKDATRIAKELDHTSNQNITNIKTLKNAKTDELIKFDLKKKTLNGGKYESGKALISEIAKNVNSGEWLIETTKENNGHGGYDLYAKLKEINEPRLTADDFIEWCADKGCLPVFYEYTNEDNYYKLLYDYNVYDCLTEEFAPQGEVKNKYPSTDSKGNITAVDFNETKATEKNTATVQSIIDKQMQFMDTYNQGLGNKVDQMTDDIIEDAANGGVFNYKNAKEIAKKDAGKKSEQEYLDLAKAPKKNEVVDLFNKKMFSEQEVIHNHFESLNELENKYKAQTKYLIMNENESTISLNNIVVKPELRNNGIGQKFLNDLIDYADSVNKTITLTPTTEFGTANKLKKWYKANGFVENKGKNTDLTILDTMYRLPNNSLRFAEQEYIDTESIDKLVKANEQLTKQVNALKQELAAIKSGALGTSYKSLKKAAYNIIKASGLKQSEKNKEKVFEIIKPIFDKLRQDGINKKTYKTFEAEEIIDSMMDAAKQIYGLEHKTVDLRSDETKEIDRTLRTANVHLTEAEKNIFKHELGENWRAQLFGRFGYSSKGTFDLDTFYTKELNRLSDSLFPIELNNENQAAYIARYFMNSGDKSSQTDVVTGDIDEIDIIAHDLETDWEEEHSSSDNKPDKYYFIAKAQEIIDRRTYRDVAVAMWDAFVNTASEPSKAEMQSEIDSLKGEVASLKNDLSRNDSQWLQDAYRIRQEYEQRENKLKDFQAERIQKITDRRKKAEFSAKIKNLKKRLETKLLKPTETSWIPDKLKDSIIQVCLAIDIQGNEYNADGTLNKSQAQRDEIKKTLTKMQHEYAMMELDPDSDHYLYTSEYDKQIDADLKRLLDVIDGETFGKFTLSKLEQVYELMKSITDTLIDATQMIGQTEQREIFDVANQLIEETKKLDPVKHDLPNKLKNLTLSPMRLVNYMSGYNENAQLRKLFDGIMNAMHKKDIFVMKAYKEFEALTTDKHGNELKEYADSKTKLVEFSNGWKITKQQAMQILLTWEREINSGGNLIHMMSNGVKVADAKLYAKGKMKESFDNANAFISSVTPEDIYALQSGLSEWDYKYMDAARYFFNTTSKNAINSVSNILKHKKLANENFYVPYRVDTDFIVKEIKYEDAVSSLNYGWTNDVKIKSKDRVMIDGLNYLLDKHINEVANYYALAIPVRNFNKVWNVKEPQWLKDIKKEELEVKLKNKELTDEEVEKLISLTSVKEVLADKFRARSKESIEQAIIDIQGSRRAEKFGAFNKVNSAFVKTALNFNISVAMKQAASLDVANAELARYRTPPEFWAGMAKTAANFKNTYTEIDKYTAQHWRRRQGLSTQELGDMATTYSKFNRLTNRIPAAMNPMKWIQFVDCLTTATFWDMCKQDAKKYSGAEVGSAEYWDYVTKEYDRVIENTQPMYDALHRPELQKNTNAMIKQLVMFRTQPLQNSGILYDAIGNYRAKAKDKNATDIEKKQAKSKLRKAMASQLTSAFVFASMTLISKALLHNLKAYRDDDDELTVQSIVMQMLTDIGKTLAGIILPVGGSELGTLAENVVKGDTWYTNDVLTVPAVDFFNNIINDINKATKVDWKETSFDELWKTLGTVVIDMAQVAGVPLKNAVNIVHGVRRWVIDIQNGNFFKFKAEEQTKTNTTTAFLEAIESGDSQAVFDVLDDVGQNGFTYQKQFTEETEESEPKTPDDYIDNFVLAAAKEGYNHGLYSLDETVNMLVQYAGYEESDAREKMTKYAKTELQNEYKDGDISLDDYINGLSNLSYDNDDKWSFVKSYTEDSYLDGTLSEQETRAILKKVGFDDDKINDKINYWNFNKLYPDTDWKYATVKTYYDEIKSQGISVTVYDRFLKEVSGLSADVDSNGNAIDGSKKKKVINAINNLPISSSQKDYLYINKMNYAQSSLKDCPWH